MFCLTSEERVSVARARATRSLSGEKAEVGDGVRRRCWIKLLSEDDVEDGLKSKWKTTLRGGQVGHRGRASAVVPSLLQYVVQMDDASCTLVY
jgi:hypothetical protein